MEMHAMKSIMKKSMLGIVAAVGIMVMSPLTASAHCDTMEGPTVADGFKAMDTNNINYVLKWVQPKYEKEITEKFNLSMKVKDLSTNAKVLAEQYFFSELVRVHRAGENAPFDGLKPYGTPIDEKVKAFGFDVVTVDGNDFDQLESAFDAFHKSTKPFCILMKTVKGKGVSFMENECGWHGKATNPEEYKTAMAELTAKLQELEA